MFIKVLLGVFLFSSTTWAQEMMKSPTLERPPAKVECLPNDLQMCTYSIQNTTAQALIRKINVALFSGLFLVSSAEGHLEEIGPKKISFYHTNPELLQKIKDIIPYLDRYDDFVATALIEISAEIYSTTEYGLRSFEAELQGISFGKAFGKTKTVEASDSVKLSFNVGSVSLSGVLGASRSSGDVEQVAKVTQIIPNLEYFRFIQQQPVYIKLTDVVTKEDKVGIEIDGHLSIAQEESSLPLVMVKNFNLSYGVQATSTAVTTVKISSPSVFLTEGVSTVLVSIGAFSQERKKGNGLLSVKRAANSSQSQLLVILRARPVSYEEFVMENRKIAQADAEKPVFSPDQVKALPQGDSNSLSKALDDLVLVSQRSPSGDPILGFRLNTELATKNILGTQVRVKVEGGGIEQQGVRTIEQLMLSTFQFKQLPLKALKKPEVKFEVSFESKTVRNKIRLLYNPQTNDFLRR